MASNTRTNFQASILAFAIVWLLTMWTASAWEIERTQSLPLRSEKRSAIDLALTQTYRICDKEGNGFLTQQELQCARRVLRILLTNR